MNASSTPTLLKGLITVLAPRYWIFYALKHFMSMSFTYRKRFRSNYLLQVTTMVHMDRPMYLLGYPNGQDRVYLIDKDFK